MQCLLICQSVKFISNAKKRKFLFQLELFTFDYEQKRIIDNFWGVNLVKHEHGRHMSFIEKFFCILVSHST